MEEMLKERGGRDSELAFNRFEDSEVWHGGGYLFDLQSSMDLESLLTTTYETLRKHVPERLLSPKIGIVCGSGLSSLGRSIRDKHEVPYSELEGFGDSTGEDPRNRSILGN